MKKLQDYSSLKAQCITFVDSEFFPDYLPVARTLYQDIYTQFIRLATSASSSEALLRAISGVKQNRIQLLRIFRKFTSPDTSVEMLKRQCDIEHICSEFGHRFRPIEKVVSALKKQGPSDDVLFALLYEYKDRGQKGYELTARFFSWFRDTFGDDFRISGPERAGKDIMLNSELPGYPHSTPADFIFRKHDGTPVAVGFARYDTDRGGAQEDDRTSGNSDKITHMRAWSQKHKTAVKLIYLNDGPGLLLGSMWKDYCRLEESWPEYVQVVTLKMLDERITKEWLLSVPKIS